MYRDILGISLAITICAVAIVKYAFNYWKTFGVRTIPPKFPFGNITDLVLRRKNFGEVFKEIYDAIKPTGEKYAGSFMFFSPVFVPLQPEIIKTILQCDFSYFGDRGFYVNEESDPLSGNLFTIGLTKWRILRTKLTPTFTSGKMKMMFQTIVSCGEGLKSVIDNYLHEKIPVNIKDVMARFNTDIIGSCAFGIECNSLKNPHVEFRIYGEKTFEPKISGLLTLLFPHSLLRKFGLRVTACDIENFFLNVVKNTVEYREKNNIHRNDFMQLLLQLKNQGYVNNDEKFKTEETESDEVCKNKLTMNELAAQCFVFFIAGYETSSTTSTFALLELALNQELQAKVRDEINKVLKKYDDKITYEAVMEMTYMDKVVYETLRKYPPLPILTRACCKEYNVPNTSIVLKKNMMVVIPVLGLHHDPEYYPEPDKFDPERFSEENKRSRPPYTWLPFGDGPRICIGLRFGMLQAKVGLITLLKNYRIRLNSKTEIPVQFEPTAFITTAKGGIWLEIEKIEESGKQYLSQNFQ